MKPIHAIPAFPKITLNGLSVEKIDRKLVQQSNKLKGYRYDGPVGRKGNWQVESFEVPKYSLEVIRLVRDGGRGMAPGTYHKLVRFDGKKRTVVMSDTDAEMIDFLDSIRHIAGHVLIGGLGMGLAIKALAKLDTIRSITVVEQSQDVIDLTGIYAEHMAVSANIPFKLEQGDIFSWKPPPTTRYDWAWFDIWDTISDENLADFGKLRTKYQKWIKGLSRSRMLFWAEKECLMMKQGIDPRNWH